MKKEEKELLCRNKVGSKRNKNKKMETGTLIENIEKREARWEM